MTSKHNTANHTGVGETTSRLRQQYISGLFSTLTELFFLTQANNGQFTPMFPSVTLQEPALEKTAEDLSDLVRYEYYFRSFGWLTGERGR